MKMASAFKKLCFMSSKANPRDHLSAYNQEGNQPVFNIYMGCQFTLSLTLVKTDAEFLFLKRLGFSDSCQAFYPQKIIMF